MMLVGVCITQYPSLAPAGSSDAGAEVDTVLGEAYSKVGIFLALLYTLISASVSPSVAKNQQWPASNHEPHPCHPRAFLSAPLHILILLTICTCAAVCACACADVAP